MKTFMIFIGMALALAACAPGGQAPASTAVPPTIAVAIQGEPDATATRQPSCTVKSPKPSAGPTQESLLPPPNGQDWIKGPDDAHVTIIEYGDFQ